MSRASEWKHGSVFMAFVLIAALGGYLGPPGAWYASLAKPSFTPPDWVFPLVWTLLYFLIAYAAARVYTATGLTLPIWLWVGQWLLNAIWTPIFFRYHLIGWALVDATALLVAAIATTVAFRPVDRVATELMAVYSAWVGFAVLLTLQIWRLNA